MARSVETMFGFPCEFGEPIMRIENFPVIRPTTKPGRMVINLKKEVA